MAAEATTWCCYWKRSKKFWAKFLMVMRTNHHWEHEVLPFVVCCSSLDLLNASSVWCLPRPAPRVNADKHRLVAPCYSHCSALLNKETLFQMRKKGVVVSIHGVCKWWHSPWSGHFGLAYFFFFSYPRVLGSFSHHVFGNTRAPELPTTGKLGWAPWFLGIQSSKPAETVLNFHLADLMYQRK